MSVPTEAAVGDVSASLGALSTFRPLSHVAEDHHGCVGARGGAACVKRRKEEFCLYGEWVREEYRPFASFSSATFVAAKTESPPFSLLFLVFIGGMGIITPLVLPRPYKSPPISSL